MYPFTLVAVRLLDRLLGVPLAAKTPLGKGNGQGQAAPKAPYGRPLGALWRLSWTPDLRFGASWTASWGYPLTAKPSSLKPPGQHLDIHLGRQVAEGLVGCRASRIEFVETIRHRASARRRV